MEYFKQFDVCFNSISEGVTEESRFVVTHAWPVLRNHAKMILCDIKVAHKSTASVSGHVIIRDL